MRVRTTMEKEGWCLVMSFPSSTIEMRWPIPGEGYKTIIAIFYDCLERNWSDEVIWLGFENNINGCAQYNKQTSLYLELSFVFCIYMSNKITCIRF
ncbi:hypothetical protein HanRHA438_Chr09g0396121 [Helianthus annuus]|nr:hypothetical protein HanIR_Chr09g0414691 [Helianthus annuus]KAJ0887903.1 hypothetical protein HanRHA438_Chr09g0396121 [Helianthus annuus]